LNFKEMPDENDKQIARHFFELLYSDA